MNAAMSGPNDGRDGAKMPRQRLQANADLRAPPSDTASAESYRESQRWVERSIERCQCPVTTRFLQRINAGIESRLRDLGEPPGAGR